ncbi:type II secretion system protein GspL [Rhodoferax mekongensis]|uniref:Type II secretion system protein GspL n=1 Tax=Rhodoferax mekongensis TaxID=3068341 RepID=A0ABZ0AYM7_9BURK|nr:type II secretion system protein GspL [Rhodoferax sp. TBRC 17307]WNO04733.1 type II secretion system protein GspL [Rhodoferax sp. TBRC 17307]
MRPLLVMPPAPHAPDGAMWDCVRSDSPQSTQQSAGVPAASGNAETLLIVPAAALSWHCVSLPPGLLGRNGQARNPTKLRAVLEGLLEDQLLDEPAQLHLAVQANAGESGALWVAACQKLWLKDTLSTLTGAGHTVRRMVPEWAPLTHADSPSTVWLTGEAASAELVWADHAGVHRRIVPPGKTGSGMAPAAFPTDAAVYAEPACAALAEQLLHRVATVQHRAQRLQSCTDTHWNLAQGEFATRNAALRRAGDAALTMWQAPAWRPARWAFALLCAVQVAGLNAQAWQARQALSSQRSAIQNVLLTTFPNTTVVVDAPLQMQRAVDALGQSSGQAQSRDLERMLEAFGALAPANVAPAAIEFVAGELRLSAFNADAEVTQRLRDGLQSRGYRTRLDGNAMVISP